VLEFWTIDFLPTEAGVLRLFLDSNASSFSGNFGRSLLIQKYEENKIKDYSKIDNSEDFNNQ